MGKRIGKYKVTQKESELSLADGGTATGKLTAADGILNGSVTVSSATSADVDISSVSIFRLLCFSVNEKILFGVPNSHNLHVSSSTINNRHVNLCMDI